MTTFSNGLITLLSGSHAIQSTAIQNMAKQKDGEATTLRRSAMMALAADAGMDLILCERETKARFLSGGYGLIRSLIW